MEKGQDFTTKETSQTEPFPEKSYQPVPGTITSPPPVPPQDYLIKAIIALICCFWPLGIFAVYKAVEARRLYQEGQYDSAEKTSKEAGYFTKLTCIVGCIMQGITWAIIIFTYAVVGITIGALFAAGVFSNATKTN
ncbi:PREDICTED: proline-rich transmembrane protein 1-like [Amphimedon queenslandica]|uniref:Interferon-induced transmembrane protein n=1 Tax=Amphimedon queenslandica TaxID=400682 RepID=A0A1X7VEQ6_AMPQE|nr:PREDICTED: proline-rich transmembrane protein 1-like [Amphimedon queenslandica]|eukprot:XP_011410461.1 PREDICTED: proline-rich transmembrane protein 1-like [Amphimedon queenslandica]